LSGDRPVQETGTMPGVVVTGIGLVTPLGADRESSWKRLSAGESGVVDGEARAPLAADGPPRAVQLALAAAREALADAGGPAGPLGERWGCLVSCSKPLPPHPSFRRPLPLSGRGEDESFPLLLGEGAGEGTFLWPDIVPSTVARSFGVTGPVMNLSSACATGLQSVMAAAEWLREGRCDAVLAGASESSLHPLYLSGFSRMGVLSGTGRVRPFDSGRDGFVIGEGAAVFVLERESAARARAARVYGALAGWDFSSDASHATRFNSGGEKIAASLTRALGRAGEGPEAVDYLSAHGTATPANDPLEVQALRRVFGGLRPRVSSTKAATGHLLGATGAAELAFCLLALRDGVLPPTLNLADPLAGDIDFLPKPLVRPSRVAATLSFGFGGSLAAAVVRKV
jgi:3-oxoacyl-[acyl-carrier-protein] synthase II